MSRCSPDSPSLLEKQPPKAGAEEGGQGEEAAAWGEGCREAGKAGGALSTIV